MKPAPATTETGIPFCRMSVAFFPLNGLGYGIEKTHADGRFEIEGVPREVNRNFLTSSTDRGKLKEGQAGKQV